MDNSVLHSKLLDWYQRSYRHLPWRETRDPYFIWLSEIILQQTRVDQGLPYYQRFTEKYPSIKDLAQADQREVLKLWEGLGYYSRARNMHAAAQMVMEDWGGEFPQTHEGILSLKGVGDYTAAAIASFAFDLKHAVLDGNVMRVLSRLHADATPINTGQGKKRFQALADDFLNTAEPALHNQAVMELGATVCKPRNPDCLNCPLQEACKARVQGNVADFPVKQRKQYDKHRQLNYWYFQKDGKTYVEQREAGIWRGLFQFPLHESDETLKEKDFFNLMLPLNLQKANLRYQRFTLSKHKLSHQTLFITIWQIQLEDHLNWLPKEHWQELPINGLKDLAFPRPIRKFLDENQLTLPLE